MTAHVANAETSKRVLIEGGINMPTGVYVRTLPAWNKGLSSWSKGHYDSLLIAQVRQIIANSNDKLSIIQIYRMLAAMAILPANHKGYSHLHFQITKAFKNGILDKSQILEGRYLTHKNLPKFKVGDKVRIIRLNERTPRSLMKELRLDKCRTIKATIPSKNAHTLYYLGTNGMGDGYLDLYAFRSSELEFYSKKTTAGRPRTKRKYTHHCKDTSFVNNSLLINPGVSPCISCVNCELAEVN